MLDIPQQSVTRGFLELAEEARKIDVVLLDAASGRSYQSVFLVG